MSHGGGKTMRFRVITPAIVGLLALAGAAAAQDIPIADDLLNHAISTSGALQGDEAGSRQARYLKKLQTLTAKVAQTKARDGGQLTPEHEASLKRERDKLNRTYGIKPG